MLNLNVKYLTQKYGKFGVKFSVQLYTILER